MEKKEKKGLLVFVYKHSHDFGDCTNGGISSKNSDLILLPTESLKEVNVEIPRIFEEKGRGIYLFYRREFDDLIACPDPNYKKGGIWWMFGGNFLYTSDSRFPSDAPIKIFDRRE